MHKNMPNLGGSHFTGWRNKVRKKQIFRPNFVGYTYICFQNMMWPITEAEQKKRWENSQTWADPSSQGGALSPKKSCFFHLTSSNVFIYAVHMYSTEILVGIGGKETQNYANAEIWAENKWDRKGNSVYNDHADTLGDENPHHIVRE